MTRVFTKSVHNICFFAVEADISKDAWAKLGDAKSIYLKSTCLVSRNVNSEMGYVAEGCFTTMVDMFIEKKTPPANDRKSVGVTGLILWTLGLFSVFILLNGWICLHGVLD